MSTKALLTTCIGIALIGSASAITVGFGPDLTGIPDTASDGTSNQMRQNINITDTVFLDEGTYHATTWDYQAAEDATNGATQPVFPFLTIVNGPANHTVIAFGETIDTEPGIQNGVPFGGANNAFVIPAGGATVAAGIQNPSEASVQNSILTDTSFGVTDHANSLNFDEASSVGATLDSFGHGGLARTYAFSIEIEEGIPQDQDGDGLPGSWEAANDLDDTDDGSFEESEKGAKDGPNGALGDPDEDGVSNADEFANSTDPQDSDSDDDTISDGDEIAAGTNPNNADTDNDGLDDADEVARGTDPTDPDSDGDGASDGREVLAGTDPNNANSFPPPTIGIGADHPGAGVDGPGSRMNIENADGTFPTLPAGTYSVTDFRFSASLDPSDIQPFLAVNTGVDAYEVIWVGPTAASPGTDVIVTLPYDPGTQQFTLDAEAAVYAGFNAAGPNVKFGTGVTDHNNPADFAIVPSTAISAWTNANLPRSYAFEINIGPPASEQFAITDFDYSPEDGMVTLKWDSREGETFALKISSDFGNWDTDLDDGIEADPGASTTRSFDISFLPVEEGELFFRVERQ